MTLDIAYWLDKFIVHCKIEKNFSENTMMTYSFHLRNFHNRVVNIGVGIENIDPKWMTSYRGYLATYLDPISVESHCSAVRSFFKFYCEELNLDINPAAEGLKRKIKLPSILPPSHSVEELNRLLEQPDRHSIIGFRDAVMIEMCWLTGLRVSEVLKLSKQSIIPGDYPIIRIRGKGNKQREIPVDRYWFESTFYDYISRAKDEIKEYSENEYVYVSNRLKPMTRQNFWLRIKKYAKLASIKDDFSPHDLRHAFAYHTLMYANSEDDSSHVLLLLQKAMGHEHLATTQRYLGITNRDVKNELDFAHPRSNNNLKIQ